MQQLKLHHVKSIRFMTTQILSHNISTAEFSSGALSFTGHNQGGAIPDYSFLRLIIPCWPICSARYTHQIFLPFNIPWIFSDQNIFVGYVPVIY